MLGLRFAHSIADRYGINVIGHSIAPIGDIDQPSSDARKMCLSSETSHSPCHFPIVIVVRLKKLAHFSASAPCYQFYERLLRPTPSTERQKFVILISQTKYQARGRADAKANGVNPKKHRQQRITLAINRVSG
jgi:hypothetical protein